MFGWTLLPLDLGSLSLELSSQSITPLLPPTKEVWGKVMFLHVSVILFSRAGVSASECGGCFQGVCTLPWTHPQTHTPWRHTPAHAHTHTHTHTHPSVYTDTHTLTHAMANERAVRILLECFLVYLCKAIFEYDASDFVIRVIHKFCK